MSLLTQLVAAYLMSNNAAPYTQTDFVGGNNLLAPNGLTPFPDPYVHLDAGVLQYLTHPANSVFNLDGDRTFAIKFRFPIQQDNAVIVGNKSGLSGWQLQVQPNTLIRLLTYINPLSPVFETVIGGPYNIEGHWLWMFFGYDSVNKNLRLQLGGEPFARLTNIGTGTLIHSTAPLLIGSSNPLVQPMNGDIGGFYIWKRILSQSEILQITNGEGWPFPPDVLDPTCTTVECCQEPEAVYNASNPTPSGASNGSTGGGVTPPPTTCIPVPVVTIQPTSGNKLEYPSYVVLTCNRTDALIYYTLDGSTPTQLSALYDEPFQIDNSGQIVQAFAVVAGCDPGPIASAQYPNAPFIWDFSFLCDTPDLVGRWGIFVPNGENDYHWRLQFTLTANTTIKRIEIYQTDVLGVWNTGQSWATDEFINPVEGPINFHTFPLEIWSGCDTSHIPPIDCGVQQNTTYLATYGTFAAGSYLWDLYGQPAFPLFGFFKIIMFLGDGTKLERIISFECVPPPPPPCNVPLEPVLTPTCNGIDVTWSETPGLPYILYRSVTLADLPIQLTQIASGVVASNPQTYNDTNLNPAALYCYKIAIKYPGCDYTESGYSCGVPKCFPVVHISASQLETCSGDQVVLSYSSSCCDGGTVAIYEGTCGVLGSLVANVTANTSGTVNVNPAVDTCYQIVGSNSCGDACDQVCVSIAPSQCNECLSPGSPPGCVDAVGNDLYTIQGFDATMFETLIGSCGTPSFCTNGPCTPWNGQMLRDVNGFCSWIVTAGQFTIKGTFGSFWLITVGQVYFNSTGSSKWELLIESGGAVLWHGVKQCGTTPAGQYTRQGDSCSTGPASFTVA